MREKLSKLLETARGHLGVAMGIAGLIWGLVLMARDPAAWLAVAVLLALGHHWARRMW